MALDYTQYVFSEEDFINFAGYELKSKMAQEQVEPFINHVADIIYTEIDRYGSDCYVEDEISEKRIQAIKKAEMYQAKYMIENDIDLSNVVGIERYTNTVIAYAELEKRLIAPMSLRILSTAGLLNPAHY
jgi:hypothetical protein